MLSEDHREIDGRRKGEDPFMTGNRYLQTSAQVATTSYCHPEWGKQDTGKERSWIAVLREREAEQCHMVSGTHNEDMFFMDPSVRGKGKTNLL